MKNNIVIVVLLISINFYAQFGGGGMNGGRNSQNTQREPREIKEFKASEAAGIFYYDVEEVVKKIKVKDENVTFKVKKALKDYNFKIKEIEFINSIKFKELDDVMSALKDTQPQDLQFNSSDQGQTMRENIGKVLRPIREQVKEHEINLNKTLEAILSEKQLKKWIKYQENIKESLQPKRPDNQNQNRRGGMSNGRMNGGGMIRQ